MAQSSTLQLGRRLRVSLSMGGEDDDLLVADFDDARADASGGGAAGAPSLGLDASFVVTRHTLREPQPMRVRVYGLSRERRERLARKASEALERAYRTRTTRRIGYLSVEAGRPGGAFGLLLSGPIMEVKSRREGADWATDLVAQDGRIEWKNAFCKETASGNTDLLTVEQILAAALPILDGEEPPEAFKRAAPELLQRKGYDGFEQGFVAFGPDWADQVGEDELLRALGLRKFWNSGRLITVGANELALDEAVVLQEGATLLRADPGARGFIEAEALLDPRLEPGRQVLLRRKDGSRLGLSAVYRVDQVEHRGSTYSEEWTSEIVLRPTGLAQPV